MSISGLIHTHTKFRRITKARADELRTKLQHSSVHNVYTEQASNLSIEDENFPRNFVTKKSLENLKTKSNASDIPSIRALRALKYHPTHTGSIHEISTDPLCVLFCPDEGTNILLFSTTKSMCFNRRIRRFYQKSKPVN